MSRGQERCNTLERSPVLESVTALFADDHQVPDSGSGMGAAARSDVDPRVGQVRLPAALSAS